MGERVIKSVCRVRLKERGTFVDRIKGSSEKL